MVRGDLEEEEAIKYNLLRREMADMSGTSPGSQCWVKIARLMMKRDSSLNRGRRHYSGRTVPPRHALQHPSNTQRGRQAGRQAGRQTDRETGRLTGRQEDRKAGSHKDS